MDESEYDSCGEEKPASLSMMRVGVTRSKHDINNKQKYQTIR